MLCQVMREHNVDCAVRNWFNSDIEVIKEHTAFLAPDGPNDEDDDDEELKTGTAGGDDVSPAEVANPATALKPETGTDKNTSKGGKDSKGAEPIVNLD